MHRKLIVSLTLNILLFGIIFGIVISQKSPQKDPQGIVPTPSLSAVQTVTPSASDLSVPPGSFQQFVELFAEVVPVLEQNQFEALAQLQPQSDVICDASAPYNHDICEGQADGTALSGWLIGYEASEGSIYSQEQFIATLTQYSQQHGPFTYGSNTIDGNHGSITLYNADQQWKLAVMVSKDNPEQLWRVQYTLLGLNLE